MTQITGADNVALFHEWVREVQILKLLILQIQKPSNLSCLNEILFLSARKKKYYQI